MPLSHRGCTELDGENAMVPGTVSSAEASRGIVSQLCDVSPRLHPALGKPIEARGVALQKRARPPERATRRDGPGRSHCPASSPATATRRVAAGGLRGGVL